MSWAMEEKGYFPAPRVRRCRAAHEIARTCERTPDASAIAACNSC